MADRLQAGAFSNARVLEHLKANAEILAHIPVRRTIPVSPEQARDFLRMTPMTFGLTEEQLDGVALTQITVAMEIMVCKLR